MASLISLIAASISRIALVSSHFTSGFDGRSSIARAMRRSPSACRYAGCAPSGGGGGGAWRAAAIAFASAMPSLMKRSASSM